MFTKGCPRADELESFASGGAKARGVAEHVTGCEVCSRIVEELRRDAGLVAELRAARREALDDETHEHLLELCRAAAQDAKVDEN